VDTVWKLKVEWIQARLDNLLEETGRPTEEEVLDYFESLGLCLDQRTQSEFNYREKWTALAEANHRASESEVKDYVVSNILW
jgi:archaellum component FlaD/FlaE